ncbi:hypothetical protein K443DRAFT_682126 [Laccaria amethystina LaAM-08-1]|uniref:Unplaced genomic scaffold K443scaffold_179, whole genome shotgun sequence n=1 Tax=Laccaria amethystina LaAM-08-1 TaxID=1095629 RepID=A0A0C9XG35_9AGAR|nr:hypothetical protein K443DRAFT_682126 [Laccaria amethystina LaAM-08-1]
MTHTLRISMRGMISLPVPTVWCSVLHADAVLWSSPLRSQHSAAPLTARPNDNHPAVIRSEAEIILATPIVRRLPQWVLVLLRRMKHNPRSCGVVRSMLARGARSNVRDPDDG